MLKNVFIFVFVSLAQQNAPVEVKSPNPVVQQVLQETQKQQNVIQQNNSNVTSMPVNKTINMMDGFNSPLGL